MRFLITGTIYQSKGPRRLLIWTLFFFLIFYIARVITFFEKFGTHPQDVFLISQNISWSLILEDIHIDLFLMMLACVLTSSCIIQTLWKELLKLTLIVLLFALPLVEGLLKIGMKFLPSLSFALYFSTILCTVFYCVTSFILMTQFFKNSRRPN